MDGRPNHHQNFDILYFHTLDLTFKSAQTIQVVKDYFYLARHGYNIHIYGVYRYRDDLKEVLKYASDSFHVYYKNKSLYGSVTIKLKLLRDIIFCKRVKLIITRHYRKARELLFIKPFLKGKKIVLEMHEECIPHLVKGDNRLKMKFLSVVHHIDAVIFTNPSQRKLFLDEFGFLPKNNIVLPNGVEIDRFQKAKRANNFVITYLGQFNRWKNVELIFKAMTYLEGKYTLRIAGGKGDEESKRFIDSMIDKYKLHGRVKYLGFVSHDEVVEKVLNDSNILVLPLGDNVQSKYLTSPMKLFEYMATSITIVAINYPSINMLVSDREIYMAKNDPKDFADKIREAASCTDDRIKRMNALVKQYSYEARAENYHRFILSIFDGI